MCFHTLHAEQHDDALRPASVVNGNNNNNNNEQLKALAC